MDLLLDLIPICGSVLSATATFVKSSLKEHDEMKKQWKRLEGDLPKLSKELEQIALKKPDLVHDLKGVVDKFTTFLSNNSVPRRLDILLKMFKTKGSDEEFLKLLEELEAQIKSTLLLISLKTFVEMGVTRDQLAELNIKHNLSLDKLKSIQDGVTGIKDGLDNMAKMLAENLGIQHLPGKIRNALAALGDARGGSDNDKNYAKKKLLKWLLGRNNPQDTLKVALIFARDGSDDVKPVGLSILRQILEDAEKRKRMSSSDEALEALLAAAQGESTDTVTQLASQYLTNLVEDEPATFFDKWEKMDKLNDSRRAIVDEDLMKQIIAMVIASVDALLPKEDQALRVLAKLAKIGVCKPVIARAGGIAALAEVYNATEKMTNDGFDATISDSVLLAIDALASLTADAECRATFAKNEANIQPLVHFLWSCSALSTEYLRYEYWIQVDDYDGWPEERNGPVLTSFGRDRVTERVWQREKSALTALCELLSDKRCRDAVMKLGTFINPKSGMPGRSSCTRGKSLKPHRCLEGWLEVANQVVKGMKDINQAVPRGTSLTPSGIPAVQDISVWPKVRSEETVAFGVDLLRAIWSVVGGDKSATEFCVTANIVMDTLTTESRMEELSRSHRVHLAMALCEIVAPQTNQFYREEDVKNLFEPLARRLIIKTRRSDMDEYCIRFLGIGAHRFSSTVDDSDEDDDSSSEDDESDDGRSGSADDSSSEEDESGDKIRVSEVKGTGSANESDSDTSKHSGSSRGSAVDECGPRQECLDRLATLWPDFEDTIRKECMDKVVRELHKQLPPDAHIKLTLYPNANNDRRSIRVKCKKNRTAGDLKKFVAKQLNTLPEKISIKSIEGDRPWLDDDHITLDDYGILDCTKLLYFT